MDRRQSLPLHRLPARSSTPRLRHAPTRAATASRERRRDMTGSRASAGRRRGDRSSATTTASSPPRRGRGLAAASTEASRRDHRRRRHRCRSLDDQAASRLRSGDLMSARSQGFDRVEDTGDELIGSAPAATYRAAVEALAARIDPDLGELLRRLGLASRCAARHGGRQCRQRLADRRHAAGADRARRQDRTPQGRERRARCRSRNSTSSTASRTREPGELVDSITVPQLDRRPRLPLLQGHQALRPGHLVGHGRLPLPVDTEGGSPRRASPTAAWRGCRSARRQREKALVGRRCGPGGHGRAPSRRFARISRRSTIMRASARYRARDGACSCSARRFDRGRGTRLHARTARSPAAEADG